MTNKARSLAAIARRALIVFLVNLVLIPLVAQTLVDIDAPTASGPPQNISYSGTDLIWSGWAMDPSSTIANVNILIDGAFLGTATYGANNRQDVCSAEGEYPGCPYVGWFILLILTFFQVASTPLQLRLRLLMAGPVR